MLIGGINMSENLKESIKHYFNNDIDLWDLVDDITIAFNSDISSVSDSIKYLENNTSDEAMLVTILLWLFPHSPFEHIEHSNNSFFNLLFSIEAPHSEFFDTQIKWDYLNKNEMTIEKGMYLIMINGTKYDISLQLPDEFTNTTLYCHNCNEEITSEYSVIVPSKSFYIFSK